MFLYMYAMYLIKFIPLLHFLNPSSIPPYLIVSSGFHHAIFTHTDNALQFAPVTLSFPSLLLSFPTSLSSKFMPYDGEDDSVQILT
jgi:hypothetical protein